MKRLFALCLVAIALTGCAGQNTGPKNYGAQATVLTGDPNNKTSLDTNFTNVQANFTELYGWVGQGVKTTSNPSFLSVHASGGNLAAANAQVTKKWITGLSYVVDVTSVIHGGKHWICTSSHTSDSTTEPGVGASYASVWEEVSGATAINDLTDVDTTGKATGKVLKFVPLGIWLSVTIMKARDHFRPAQMTRILLSGTRQPQPGFALLPPM